MGRNNNRLGRNEAGGFQLLHWQEEMGGPHLSQTYLKPPVYFVAAVAKSPALKATVPSALNFSAAAIFSSMLICAIHAAQWQCGKRPHEAFYRDSPPTGPSASPVSKIGLCGERRFHAIKFPISIY